MSKNKYISLLLFPLLLSGCSNNSLLEKEVDITRISNYVNGIGEGEYADKCSYKDVWFLEDSYNLNYELALASSLATGASYSNALDKNGSKIAKFLEDTGFEKIQKNYYYQEGVTLEDSIGAIMAQKQIATKDKKYTLLAIFSRNGGYANEWAGNFNLNKDGYHEGFMLARDEMLRFMKHYIISNEVKGDLKVWAAGYSRGAAAVNLLGGFLADGSDYFGSDVSLTSKDVYAYTLGTPSAAPSSMVSRVALSVSGPREGYFDTDIPAYSYAGEGTIIPTDSKYDYVHNFVITGDIITKMPPTTWDFTRYGKTENIVFGDEATVAKLRELSPESADMFANGRNAITKEATSTFDFDKFEVVDSSVTKSPNSVIDSHINALSGISNDLNSFIDEGYIDVIKSIVATIGNAPSNAIDEIEKLGTGTFIKALGALYASKVGEKLGLSDEEAVASLAMDFLELCGKEIGERDKYTDQQFLAHMFDLFINDYQVNEKGKMRVTKLAMSLPEPYGDLVLNVAKYAANKNFKLTYFDDFLFLVASYYNDNQSDEAVNSLIDKLADLAKDYSAVLASLAGGTYEGEPIDVAKAAIRDILKNCVNGLGTTGANTYRAFVLMAVAYAGFSGKPKLIDLVMNGIMDDEGKRQTIDGAPLKDTVKEILSLVLEEDEETHNLLTLKETANKALVEILEKLRNEVTGKYVDVIEENIELTKEIVMAFVFKNNNNYNLKNDIDNALTLYKSATFLAPSHYIEYYICYLKTKVA